MPEKDNRKWYVLDGKTLGNLIVVCFGVTLYLLLTHLSQVRETVGRLVDVFSPFLIGFVIAYLLHGPVNFLERKLFYRMTKESAQRGAAIVTVYLVTVILSVILLQLIIPQLVDSISGLANNLSGYLDNLDQLVNNLIQRFHLDDSIQEDGLTGLVNSYDALIQKATDFLSNSVPELLNLGRTLGGNIVSGVITAMTALIASIYMLGGKRKLTAQIKKFLYALLPRKRVDWLLDVAGRSNDIFAGFINAKVVDSAIIGGLCFILSVIFRIPYAILVSVVVGVTNLIPFFGPIIGAVPCLMILLVVSPWAALRFGVLIVTLQQFDGNILGPKILGDSTGLPAFWVLVAIVMGGGLFGFPGMLLGVPTFAVFYSLLREWTESRLAQKGIDASGEPLSEETE